MSSLARAGLAGAALVGGVSAAAPARAPIVAIERIEPGEWLLKPLGATGGGRTLCLADAVALVEYGHGGSQCRRRVLVNQTDTATVQYVCPGAGHGTTTFKVATPRSFNLETQGILGGQPFDEQYEARRTGECDAH